MQRGETKTPRRRPRPSQALAAPCALLALAALGHASERTAAPGRDGERVPGPEETEPRVDQATLERGESAFFASCTACHPASRALDKDKGPEGWRETVERMSQKPGAPVAAQDVDAIVAFLAHRGATRAPQPELEETVAEPDLSRLSALLDSFRFHGTLSVAWRDSGHDDRLENRGFTPEIWAGAEWHPPESSFRARVTACTTCHSGSEPGAGPVELVEASFALDVDRLLGAEDSSVQASAEAGRFIVPFGAFSAQVNPAAYRTVTRPLIYSMGQLVDPVDIGSSVLPMPYSDEGVKLGASSPLPGDLSVDLDVYAVNGLQGNFNVSFLQSRSYTDNNGDPAFGARLALVSPSLSLGVSGMTGDLESGGGGPAGRFDYAIYGLDVNARIGKRLRLVGEIARRENDQATFDPVDPKGDLHVEGYLVEGNLLLWEDPGISFVGRLDFLRHDGPVPLPGSSLDESFRITRTTWGLDFALLGGSNLMINHEHWDMPDGLSSVDVLGARWVVTL